MKKIFNLISIISVIIVLCVYSFPAGAEDYKKSALKTYVNSNITICNTGSLNTENFYEYYRITIPRKGKIVFHVQEYELNPSSRVILVDSSGKKVISGKFSNVINKKYVIANKGTYYLKITYFGGNYIKNFWYSLIYDSGKNISNNIKINAGKSLDPSKYIKNFSGNIKWYSYDERIAGEHNGKIWGENSGSTVIEGVSENGDYIKFKATVSGNKSETEKWLTNYTLNNQDIERMRRISCSICAFTSGKYCFKEGMLSEERAIGLIVKLGHLINYEDPYYNPMITVSNDPLMRFNYAVLVDEDKVDYILYHLFGIKASHKFDTKYGYHFGLNYYFPDAAAGSLDDFKYISYQKLEDGRFILKYDYMTYKDHINDKFIYDHKDVFVLMSIYEEYGVKYPRIHAISNKRSSLVK